MLWFLWPMFYLAPFPRYSAIKETENHPTLSWAPNRGNPSNFIIKVIGLKVLTFIYFQWKPCDPTCSCFVTVHSCHRRWRQTTYHDDSWTLQWWIQDWVHHCFSVYIETETKWDFRAAFWSLDSISLTDHRVPGTSALSVLTTTTNPQGKAQCIDYHASVNQSISMNVLWCPTSRALGRQKYNANTRISRCHS